MGWRGSGFVSCLHLELGGYWERIGGDECSKKGTRFGYLHGDGCMVLEICLEEEWCVSVFNVQLGDYVPESQMGVKQRILFKPNRSL